MMMGSSLAPRSVDMAASADSAGVNASSAASHCVIVSPAEMGGVRDYADVIALATGASLAIFTDGRIIPVRGNWDGCGTIYLQMSGYGYEKRGVPLALLAWLRRQKRAGKRIGVFFHELYAFGPPWTSSFWLSPAQRYIAAASAQLSDYWLTNRQATADWLLRWTGQRPHAVLPTPSNVGEQENYPLDKQKRFVVFGTPELRERTYRHAGTALFDWACQNGFEIHDIGSPITNSQIASQISHGRVIEHGRLEVEALGSFLSDTALGAVAYPPAYAAKSSVLAAYCANGVCPVIYWHTHTDHDGLVAGKNYVGHLSVADRAEGGWTSIGRAAFDWYRQHRTLRHIEGFLALEAGEA